jgi:hypothetical protein
LKKADRSSCPVLSAPPCFSTIGGVSAFVHVESTSSLPESQESYPSGNERNSAEDVRCIMSGSCVWQKIPIDLIGEGILNGKFSLAWEMIGSRFC